MCVDWAIPGHIRVQDPRALLLRVVADPGVDVRSHREAHLDDSLYMLAHGSSPRTSALDAVSQVSSRATVAAQITGAVGAVTHDGHLPSLTTSRNVPGAAQSQRLAEPFVGELVADPATLGGGDHAPATLPKTGEVVGEVDTGRAQGIGQLGRIGGSVEQLDEDPAADRVGDGDPDAVQEVEVDYGGRCGEPGSGFP